MKKRFLFSTVLIFIFFTSINAQRSDNTFWNDVRFGGGFNLGFGNNYTTIAISPSAIYNFSNNFSSGLSISYLYSKNKAYDTSSNVFGASIISLYNVLNRIQLSAEFEELNINYKNSSNHSNSYWNPALYFGASYRAGGVSIGLRYDVLHNDDSIYSSAFTPVFRVYF